LNGFLAYL